MMTTAPIPLPLRGPRAPLAGCLWLARFADKARLNSKQALPDDYAVLLGHPRGVDGYFLRHFGLEKESVLHTTTVLQDDEAVERWFIQQPGVTEASLAEWNEIAPALGREGHPGESELRFAWKKFYGISKEPCHTKSLFELIEFDEAP